MSVDIVTEIATRIDKIRSLLLEVDQEIAILTPLIHQSTFTESTESFAHTSAESESQESQKTSARASFVSVVAGAYEVEMEWQDYVNAAQDTQQKTILKPYLAYLDDARLPDCRILMIIPPCLGLVYFASPPCKANAEIKASVHNFELDISKGLLIGNVDMYLEWHKTRKADLTPLNNHNIALYGSDETPILVKVNPFARIVRSLPTLLDSSLLYQAFLCYSSKFYLSGQKTHPSVSATKCFGSQARPLPLYSTLFFDVDD